MLVTTSHLPSWIFHQSSQKRLDKRTKTEKNQLSLSDKLPMRKKEMAINHIRERKLMLSVSGAHIFLDSTARTSA